MLELNLSDVMSNDRRVRQGFLRVGYWSWGLNDHFQKESPLGWNTWVRMKETGSRDSPEEPGGHLDFSVIVMENC